jgi:hypothetical protein
MKHISEHLLNISQQQLIFQNRLDVLADLVCSLYESSNLEIMASMPKVEADLSVLRSMNARINQGIQLVN